MKLSTIFAGAAIAATSASAQQAVVHNKCTVPIYVQSFPYDGGAAGPLTTVQPGQAFSEDFRKSGSVRHPSLPPLTFSSHAPASFANRSCDTAVIQIYASVYQLKWFARIN